MTAGEKDQMYKELHTMMQPVHRSYNDRCMLDHQRANLTWADTREGEAKGIVAAVIAHHGYSTLNTIRSKVDNTYVTPRLADEGSNLATHIHRVIQSFDDGIRNRSQVLKLVKDKLATDYSYVNYVENGTSIKIQ
jgi:hypothetical protein